MNCHAFQKLISEYADGRLDGERQSQVKAHLAACPTCSELVRDVQKMRTLLRSMPLSQTSAQFEARLAARIAPPSPAAKRPSRLAQAAPFFRPQNALWRPALALGVAAASVAAALFWHPAAPPVSPPAISERVLVTHCVQQHRSYVGAQPLSDVAAQTLANQLDQTASMPGPVPGENDL